MDWREIESIHPVMSTVSGEPVKYKLRVPGYTLFITDEKDVGNLKTWIRNARESGFGECEYVAYCMNEYGLYSEPEKL